MPKLAELNAMDPAEFKNALGGIFEHSPWVAERTASKRPFRDQAALLAAMREVVEKSGEPEKVALIRSHPELVGNATLTRESESEQNAAGLGRLSAEEIDRFRSFNTSYRERFGFPFVICARMNKKDAILEAFPIRLQNSRIQEMETALGEIYKIAELRLNDTVE
jgi:2-oxo-4-hydroxy-4-carboxy-5-ureidoimidazoline decarboxylase